MNKNNMPQFINDLINYLIGIKNLSAIYVNNMVITLEQFLEFLKEDESLGMILRSKGILKGKDTSSWYYFDYVAGDYSISEGNPSFTGRIVVIGSKIDEHRIQEKFMEIVK